LYLWFIVPIDLYGTGTIKLNYDKIELKS